MDGLPSEDEMVQASGKIGNAISAEVCRICPGNDRIVEVIVGMTVGSIVRHLRQRGLMTRDIMKAFEEPLS